MVTIRLKDKKAVHNHCTLILLYMCPGNEQLNKWRVSYGAGFLLLEWEITDKQEEEAKISHMVMDQSWRQYELMFSRGYT